MWAGGPFVDRPDFDICSECGSIRRHHAPNPDLNQCQFSLDFDEPLAIVIEFKKGAMDDA